MGKPIRYSWSEQSVKPEKAQRILGQSGPRMLSFNKGGPIIQTVTDGRPVAFPPAYWSTGGRWDSVMDLAKTLKIDSVSRLHATPPLCIAPEQSVAEAVQRMRQERVGCVLVCVGEKIVGIFTERDLMRRVLAAGKPLTLAVSECMTANPVVVHRKEPIGAAVRRMEEGGYRHLPVVDEANHLVGVLSVKRIVHYLVEHFPTTIYNLPPQSDCVQQEREGA